MKIVKQGPDFRRGWGLILEGVGATKLPLVMLCLKCHARPRRCSLDNGPCLLGGSWTKYSHFFSLNVSPTNVILT